MKICSYPRNAARAAALFLCILCIATITRSQPKRMVGGDAVAIDDSHGHSIMMIPPSTLSSGYSYILPSPPSIPGLSAGFIGTGNTLGQIAVWDGSEWVWSNAVSASSMNNPFSPFDFTFNVTAGPSESGSVDLGDDAHHFGTIYVDNIVGANIGGGGGTSLPSQTGNNGKVLMTNGSSLSWQSVAGTGTVTSVGLSGGSTGLTTSGGPVTASGTITLGGTLALTNGGTGAMTANAALNNLLPSQAGNANKVLQSDGTNASWQTMSAGSGTVTSVSVSGGTTGLTSSGGPITNTGTITLGGTLAIANGGTGATTQNVALNNLLPSQSGNGNKYLQTDGTNASWQTLPASGTVNSVAVSGGSTGLTTSGGPITNTGTITLGGTLALANGGTGATTQAAAVNNLLPSQTGNGTKYLQTDGSNVSWQSLPASGTVNSVAVSGGSTGLTTSGGPITNTGTITLGGTLAITNGGTGATTQAAAINNLLPSQTGNATKVLQTDGTNVSWQTVSGGGSGWGLSGNAIASNNVFGTTNAFDLVIETNAQERMRILNSGNVGIGATNPSQSLEVRNGNVLVSNSTGTAGQIQLQGTGSGVTSISAGAQGSNAISYVLPVSQGAASSTLSNDGSGNLSWSNIGQVKFVKKTSNQDVTSTTPVNDAHLGISIGANETYSFEIFLSVSDPNFTGDAYKLDITAPSGATLKYGYMDATTSASTGTTIINGSGNLTRSLTLNNATEVFIYIKGVVINGSNSGTLQLQEERFGGANGDIIRFNANSYMQATRVQ